MFQSLNDVSIANVNILTLGNPYSLYGDGAITINDCTNINITDVKIDGSYSLEKKYGYGINMNNVWNSLFVRFYGRGAWGIFGNNNINETYLEDCDINRFDIHCYGKNVTCKGCTFKNYYNQYSGVYGIILYNECFFDNFTPYINGGSYNAHVPVEVILKNCLWRVNFQKDFIVDDRGFHEPY